MKKESLFRFQTNEMPSFIISVKHFLLQYPNVKMYAMNKTELGHTVWSTYCDWKQRRYYAFYVIWEHKKATLNAEIPSVV